MVATRSLDAIPSAYHMKFCIPVGKELNEKQSILASSIPISVQIRGTTKSSFYDRVIVPLKDIEVSDTNDQIKKEELSAADKEFIKTLPFGADLLSILLDNKDLSVYLKMLKPDELNEIICKCNERDFYYTPFTTSLLTFDGLDKKFLFRLIIKAISINNQKDLSIVMNNPSIDKEMLGQALVKCVRENKFDLISYILRHPNALEISIWYIEEAIFYLLEENEGIEAIKQILLLPNVADLNASYYSKILLYAAKKNDSALVEFILQKLPDQKGLSILGKALVYATIENRTDISIALFEKLKYLDKTKLLGDQRVLVDFYIETKHKTNLGIVLALGAFNNDAKLVDIILNNPIVNDMDPFYLQMAIFELIRYGNFDGINKLMHQSNFWNIKKEVLDEIYKKALERGFLDGADLFLKNIQEHLRVCL